MRSFHEFCYVTPDSRVMKNTAWNIKSKRERWRKKQRALAQ